VLLFLNQVALFLRTRKSFVNSPVKGGGEGSSPLKYLKFENAMRFLFGALNEAEIKMRFAMVFDNRL
jgi:hypothetical protein